MYCGDEARHYHGVKEVLRHIDNSSAATFGEEHDELKRGDGWYDDGFYAAVRKILERKHLEIIWEPELDKAMPHSTRSGMFLGDFGDRNIPAHAQRFINESDAPPEPPTALPSHRAQHITLTEGLPPYTEVPARRKRFIRETVLAAERTKKSKTTA